MKKNIFILILLFSIPAFGQKEIIITLGNGSSGGDALANFYLKDSSLASDRTVDLGGKFLRVSDGANVQMNIDPVGVTAVYTAYDGIADVGLNNQANSATNNQRFSLFVQDASALVEILGEIDTGTEIPTLTYTADTHTFNGSIQYDAPVSGAATDSVLTWDAATNQVNMRDAASFGGSSTPPLSSVLIQGNNTQRQYIVNDSVATASGSGLSPFELRPQNYLTAYGGIIGTQGSFTYGGYGYYPGVNADGRPNVVAQLFGYNGGYGTSTIAGEVSAGMRFESHFNSGGRTLIESHGFFPEIVTRSGETRRLGSIYSDDSTGYSNAVFHIDGVGFFQGNTDTILMNLEPGNITFGLNNNGHVIVKNQRIPSNNYDLLLGDAGVNFSITGGVTPSLGYFQYTSPIIVSTNATIGTTQAAAIQAKVGTAGYAGLLIAQVGLTSSSFKGIYGDINTTGTFDLINARNTGTGGVIETVMQASANSGVARHVLQDSNGWAWYMKFNGGTNENSLYFNFNGADSLLKIRGDNGNVYAKYNAIIGSGTGTTAPTSTLLVNGSFGTAYVAKTGSYTLTISDYTVNVTSGTNTQTLPTAVGVAGRIYVITNSGSGVVTVGTTSSQTFANVVATPTTLTLSQFNTVTVQSDGANWLRLTNL